MQLKMMGRLLAAVLLNVATGCQGDEADILGVQETGVGTQCVRRFDGVTSCATGNAKLATSERGIQVSGLADATKDGISSTFARAKYWRQDVDVKFSSPQVRLSLAARAGDQVVSTLQITPGRSENSVGMLPSFSGAPGGSAYRMNVYRDGVLQGGTTQPAGRSLIFFNWRDFLRWAFHNDLSLYDIEFFGKAGERAASSVGPSPGACVWRMRNQQGLFSVTLDDGKVLTGNGVEFIEQIADGHYPYTDFTAIDVKAGASSFTIAGETFVPAK